MSVPVDMLSIHERHDEIRIIRNAISRVDALLQQLQVKRVTLLQRLNNLQSSTRVLPPETLSLIFKHACPLVADVGALKQDQDMDDTHSVLTLGHVSSYWRQVAWSTPQLWTHMSTHIDRRHPRGVATILELYLKNVGGLPFSLDVIFAPYLPNTVIHPIQHVLFKPEYSCKVENLRMVRAPTSWMDFIPLRLSQLKHISLGEPLHSQNQHSLAALAQLYHVALHGSHNNLHNWNIKLPWLSLTKLELSRVPLDVCANILTQCFNLVEFHSTFPRDALTEVPASHSSNPPTILYYLQDFSWLYHDSPWCLAAIQHIRLPALRTLTWDNGFNRAEDVEPIVMVLFHNLPSTLHVLCLTSLDGWTLPLIRHVFSECLSLRELRLAECEMDDLCMIFSVLCPDWDGEGTKYLPSLKSLTVGSVDEYGEVVTELRQEFSFRILELCRGRFNGPGSSFSLHFTEIEVDLAHEVSRALRRMIQRGFQVELVDSNGRVE